MTPLKHFHRFLFLFIFELLFFSNITTAQATSPTLDSLITVYESSSNPIKKTKLLLKICALPACQNLDLAYTYAQKACEEAQKTKMDSLIALARLTLAQVLYKMGRLRESEKNLYAAVPVFEKYHRSEKVALTKICFGIINRMRYKPDLALKFFKEALSMTKSKYLKIKVYDNLVQVYQSTGKYGQAFDCINQYSKIAHQLGDANKILNAHFLMAMLHVHQWDLQKSQDYLQKIVPLVKNPGAKYRLADIYHSTAVSLIQEEKYEAAASYNQKDLELRLDLGDKLGLASSFIHSSIINTKIKNFALALEHLKEGWRYSKSIDNSHQSMMVNYSILAFVLDSNNRKYDDAVLADFELKSLSELVQTLERTCNNTRDFCLSSNIQTLLLQHSLDNKDLEKAFMFQARLLALKDSIFAQRQQRSVSEFDFKLYTKNKEKELSNKARQIALLEKDQLENQAFLLFAAAAFLVLLLILILINSQRKQLKKEKELTDSQLENARLILRQKKLELSHFAQQIIYKNNLINQLETDIESRADVVSNNNQLEKIELLRQQTILTKEDWNKFKDVFSEVYPSFIDNVNEKFTKLTPAELRMFMLLKLLLSKQQIAGVLGISAESVRKAQYRLKKKLKLSHNEDLETFAQSFE